MLTQPLVLTQNVPRQGFEPRLDEPKSPVLPLHHQGEIYSVAPFWWRWSGSNRRPPQCHCGALPTELHPQKSIQPTLSQFFPAQWFFYFFRVTPLLCFILELRIGVFRVVGLFWLCVVYTFGRKKIGAQMCADSQIPFQFGKFVRKLFISRSFFGSTPKVVE